MVYELLPCRTVYHTIYDDCRGVSGLEYDYWPRISDKLSKEYPKIELVCHGLRIQLLATCKLIKEEAGALLKRKLRQLDVVADKTPPLPLQP
jgi:hypothetical protein